MKRSELTALPEYFDRYINKCDDVELLDAIRISIDELHQAPVDKWEARGDYAYAPGKWTVKDLLQHLVDTERIFTFRALAYARGEKQAVPSYDEDAYAVNAQAGRRTVRSLVDELLLCHQSVLAMFESFTPEMLDRMCQGFKGEYSVACVGFLLPGHQRWHLQVLEERYFS